MTHQKYAYADKEIEKLQNNFFTLSDAVEFWYKKDSVGLHQGFSFKDSLNILYIFPEKMRGTWSHFMCLFVFHPLIITIKKERKMRLCKYYFPGQDSFVYYTTFDILKLVLSSLTSLTICFPQKYFYPKSQIFLNLNRIDATYH